MCGTGVAHEIISEYRTAALFKTSGKYVDIIITLFINISLI